MTLPKLTIFIGHDSDVVEKALERLCSTARGSDRLRPQCTSWPWPERDRAMTPVHPSRHGDIADEFLGGGSLPVETSVPVVTCTHSDPFILRIRRRIAEGTLSPTDVSLVWVEPNGTEKPIPLNERGTPAWWPKGVFAEAQVEFHEIRRALHARGEPEAP